MNLKISDIMFKNFKNVNLLEGVKKLQNYVSGSNFDFFPVYDGEILKGIVTYKELMGVHPNRIVADIKIKPAITISHDEIFWKAVDIINQNETNILLVIEGKNVIGVVTDNILKMELGKHIDILTGLYKSGYIYYNINELIKEKSDFSIVFIDINSFGYIDKEYGHIEGDKLLIEFSKVLKNSLPKNSYVCRFGGDEFVILLKHNSYKTEEYINSLIDTVEKYKFSMDINVKFTAGIITISNSYNNKLEKSGMLNIINKASLICSKAKKNNLPYIILNNTCSVFETVIS